MATRSADRPARPSTLFVTGFVVALLALVATVAGCGSDARSPNDADRAFLQQMIPHHERAIAVARIGARDAHDPRVRTFAARIVREQTPELSQMRTSAAGLDLDLAAGARTAHHRISDAEVAQLRALSGTAFDRQFLRLHIVSETGAAEMAEDEIHSGKDDTVLRIAMPIATAPDTQIPELRRLLAALG